MKVYNFTDLELVVGQKTIGQSYTEIPETYRGDLTIGGQQIEWDDDPYQYILITDDNGIIEIDSPIVPEAPWVSMVWLMTCIFSLTLTVKIMQKLKMGR